MKFNWSVADSFAKAMSVIVMYLSALMACFWWAFIPSIGDTKEAAAKGAVAFTALLLWGPSNFRKTVRDNKLVAYGGMLFPTVVGCLGFAFGIFKMLH